MSKRYIGTSRTVNTTSYFDTWKFYAAQTTPVNREIRIDGLNPGIYDVRITRVTPVSTDPRLQTTSKWSGMGEIVLDDLYYPNVALLGLRVKATGQLSGDVTVLTEVTRADIEVFDENGNFVGLRPLNNPAWVFWDILTNKVYGYGLPYNQIDYTTIVDWAEWCDEMVTNGIDGYGEPRARFNGVFDFDGNLWDALVKVATVGRGAPMIKGTKYSVIVDKAAPMVQLFNMGNIVKDSLKITYIGNEDLATEIEIQYTNADNNYNNDTLSVVVPEWFTQTSQEKKTTIQQMGITNQSQAYRAGRYYLNCNKNLRRTADFTVAVDALDSEAGDVIGISHDVPMWGQSGRLESATDATVTLDKDVTLVDGNTYNITVRQNDNSFESFDIVFSGTQTTKTLIINGTFATIPKQYDIYSLIESPHTIKLFRISSITRADNNTRNIKAVEYNESIVTDSTTIVETQSASEFNPSPKIINFNISEHLVKKNDGGIVSYLDFSWDIDKNVQDSILYDIYIAETSTYHVLQKDITTKSFSYYANSIEENKQYSYYIIARMFGWHGNMSFGTTAIYTLRGKSEKPASIKNISATWSNGHILLSWDKNYEVDFAHYEIALRGQIYTTTTNSLQFDNLDIGDYDIEAYAVDTSGNKSMVTNYALHVAQPTTIYMIRDTYLIEKAFIDGAMTIYTSFAEPSSPNIYDIWKVSVENISLGDFTFEFELLKGLSWDVGTGVELYKYYNGKQWLLCTTEQTAVVRRMLGQLTTAGIVDNEVKVFNVQPYTPYNINDLWINDLTIMTCVTDRASGGFDSADWILHTKEEITIASKIENVKGA